MKVFQIENSEESPSPIKRTVLAAIVLLIVISFFWQMALGLCPVP